MEFKEVLENESELTREIREEAADFEGRAQDYLDSLLNSQDEEKPEAS